ncbi:MAG TPA: YqgE/AlgH family protein [Kiloniellaceae bacterium]|nr:YqgE/AlgH family protein [Kiloniellaceae bacterium]
MTWDNDESDGYLTGQMLIAMPSMRDARFARTVIFLCAHNEDGAMGLVVNRLVGAITFPDLLGQLGIDVTPDVEEIRVHFGGPVESGRGFVLHSADYSQDSTLDVDGRIALTATVDILKDIAAGTGPRQHLMALGYAGWGPGQLDSEIQANGWLHVEADDNLIFGEDLNNKWEHAIGKLGVSVSMLSDEAGHA